MATLNKGSLFPQELAKEMFSKVKGHSSLAALSNSEPVPFNGKDIFTFNFSNDISIVGESAAKPAGDLAVSTVQIRPIKVVYQARVSDEFLTASEEAQLNVLKEYSDGWTKKLGRGLDLMALHGVNPATGTASALIGTNNFDSQITGAKIVSYNSSTPDVNVDAAISIVDGFEYDCNGLVISPAVRDNIAALSTNNNGRKYPEFAWGGCPNNLGALKLEKNVTVSANSSPDKAFVGDFENAFRWGYAEEIPLEIIEYGDPDGSGKDLKQYNQVLLRSEAYIGWAIMDNNAFAKIATVTP